MTRERRAHAMSTPSTCAPHPNRATMSNNRNISRINQAPSASDAPVDADELLSRATYALADAHEIALASWLDDAERDSDADERKRVVQQFEAIPRANYAGEWNRTGRTLFTPLHRAACRQKIAEVTDDLFRCSLKHGAVLGLPWPPSSNIKPSPLVSRRHGLLALADQCEREWRRAHEAALGEQVKHAA